MEGRTEWHDEKRKGKKEILHYKQPCFTFTVPMLMPGDYTIPFQFALPQGIPSSIMFQGTGQKRPKAKVKYCIKAILRNQRDESMMKYKQVLIVREQGDAYQTNINQSQTNNVKTWCCMDQGPSTVNVNFEKNVFEPTDVCKATVNVNNSQCNLNINHVRLAIEQDLRLTTSPGGGHSNNETFVLQNQDYPGVAARGADKEPRPLEVDLKQIKYVVAASRKKKGVDKPLSVEDRYMLENIAANCKGRLITNQYFLTVRCDFAGCTCCSRTPVCRIPITIVPIINPQVWGYQQPQDFSPQVYQACNFAVQYHA